MPYDQKVWQVIFALSGPICARALNLVIRFRLVVRGHHDWPDKGTSRQKDELLRSLRTSQELVLAAATLVVVCRRAVSH